MGKAIAFIMVESKLTQGLGRGKHCLCPSYICPLNERLSNLVNYSINRVKVGSPVLKDHGQPVPAELVEGRLVTVIDLLAVKTYLTFN
jgi:hypothetical protein